MRRSVGMRLSSEGRPLTSDEAVACQRLALFANTSVDPEVAVLLEEADLTTEYLARAGVVWDNVVAAGLTVTELHSTGMVCTLDGLCRLGLDALEVGASSELATALVDLYGREEVRNAFLVTPQDATAVAGAPGQEILCVSPAELLELCAGSPYEARAVLVALGEPEVVMKAINAQSLLDAGIRGKMLREIGFTVARVSEHLPGISPTTLRQLGLVEMNFLSKRNP